MAYIGNEPSVNFTSFAKQDITGDGGASYTLTYAVANANEIEVFVNNVRQEPSIAYTVTGTALSMTGNVASTDDFYVIYLGKALQTTVPPDASVSTAKIVDSAVTNAKISNSTIDLTSKVTGTLPVANSQTNTPAFQARRSTGFQFSDNTDTKVTGFTTDFDTDSNFASDRFTPTTAGKYFVTIQGSIQGVASYDMYNGNIHLRKNGTELLRTSSQGNASSRSNRYGLSLSLIVDMNGTSDYLEMFVYLNNVTTGDGIFNLDTTSFGAYKLIGA